MTISFVDYLIVAFCSALGSAGGAYFLSYLRKKGENLATHADIAKLVEQVEATTTATEAIRNELSGQQWELQERWKLRREMYVSLISGLSDAIRGQNGAFWMYRHAAAGTLDEQHAKERQKTYEEMAESGKARVRDAWALASIIDPPLAAIVDELWTRADKVDADISYLRQRAELYNEAMAAVVARGRSQFSGLLH